MRWLGMTAAIAALLAAVLNIIWFSRHLSGFGAFVTVAWPAVLGTIGFMAFTVALGIVTVRLMLRRDAEEEAAAQLDGSRSERPGDEGDAPSTPVTPPSADAKGEG